MKLIINTYLPLLFVCLNSGKPESLFDDTDEGNDLFHGIIQQPDTRKKKKVKNILHMNSLLFCFMQIT